MDRTNHGRTALAGWLVAAGMLGIMVGSGFQSADEKFGMVNVRKVIMDSKLNQDMTDRVEVARKARVSILEFMNIQQVLTEEQANGIRDLELKETKTEEDQKALETIQQAVIAAVKEFDRLNGILELTEPERLLLQDYHQRRDTTRGLLQAWTQEFEQDFARLREQAMLDAVELAEEAASVVAGKEGYTVLFSSSAVIYAANDITESATVEANK